MADNEARVNMVAPRELLDAFDRTAEAEDLTRSQALRKLMKRYVAENGQTDWIDAAGSRKGAKK
jgi:metal-responsive CopG/Arc/MetJ family transcriptional regulator